MLRYFPSLAIVQLKSIIFIKHQGIRKTTDHICARVKSRCIGDGKPPTFNRESL